MTEPWRLSRDRIAQLTDEQVLACIHSLSIRSSSALFKPGDWHLKRLLILCFVSSDKCSHLIGHFSPTESIFEQVFNTDLKRNCNLTYYFVSHSCSTLNSGAWLTQRLIRCCPHHSTQQTPSWHWAQTVKRQHATMEATGHWGEKGEHWSWAPGFTSWLCHFPACVTLSKTLHLSVPQFLH